MQHSRSSTTTLRRVPMTGGLRQTGRLRESSCRSRMGAICWTMSTSWDIRLSSRKSRSRPWHKGRTYESLGVSIRYVPLAPLIDWATVRLSSVVIDRVLNAPVNGNPAKDASAFISRMGLDIDALRRRIRQQGQTRQVEDVLAPLRASNLAQIESRARQVLQTIRDKQLPLIDRAVTEASATVQHEIRLEIQREVRATLQDRSRGGIASARRFLELLYERISELQREIDELAKQHRIAQKQSLSTISRTHYTLRSVVMGMPPWPVAALGIVSVVLLPFFYYLQLISQVIRPLSRVWGGVTFGILFIGILGILAYIVRRLGQQRKLVSDQHMQMIRERFELESTPLLHRAIRSVYDATQKAAKEAGQDLVPLVNQLRSVASQMDHEATQSARDLGMLAAPGPFRSAIDLEQAEQFLAQLVAHVERFSNELTNEIGYVGDWEARCTDQATPLSGWLGDQLSRIGARYVERRVRTLNVLDILTQDMSLSKVQDDLRRMLETARPLWNYDPRVLRRAKTQRMTFVGVDTSGSGWARVVGPLSKVQPDVIPFDTEDPLTVVVLRVHRGLPLFALRRIGEYRSHYAQTLWRSKLPMHTTRVLILSEDLIPFHRRVKFPSKTLFAVGLALGAISRDADGRYIAPRPKSQTIRLSTRKERSVALLSMDEAACRELQRQLVALVASKGKRALCTILDEYMTVMPDLEDWEVKGILEFGQVCGLMDEKLEHTNQEQQLIRT
jgi:hypothetical protein